MRFAAPAGPAIQSRPRFSSPGYAAPSGHPPTGEQEAIIDAFKTEPLVVVEALAGTGKTTTLRMLAALDTRRPGVYLAYNKSTQLEAQGRFPQSVMVSTAHGLAYQALGHRFGHRLPGRGSAGGRRMYARDIADRLKVKPGDAGGAMLSPVMITRLAEATISGFCQSGDLSIGFQHLPARAEYIGPLSAVGALVVPVAEEIWKDLCNERGRFYFTHDHYLKQWQLSRPKLQQDYVLFDEAQDANPVIAALVADQTHAQLVYVGDRNQQLYAWRGAVDAMQSLPGARLALTKSFRFGPAIAAEANKWLELLGSPHRLVGHDPVSSRVGPFEGAPDAILCRTNGTALATILGAQAAGIPVAMAPGDRSAGADIRSFAFAARDLMAGKGTDNPELCAFKTWADLLQYVEEEEGGADLRRLVNICNRIGPNSVIDAIMKLVPKEKAQLTVSTAHKAKGLEWNRVRVADDFVPPEEEEVLLGDPSADAPGMIGCAGGCTEYCVHTHGAPQGEQARHDLRHGGFVKVVDPADLMLAYVTVTRAKNLLDPGPLNPIDWSN